jgi:hypothetical protein
MIGDLEVVRPAGRLFRVSRVPDPWAWPAWEYAGADGTFGNRWDDPQAVYRALYACSELQGCFMEVLSRFRPDLAGLAAIEGAGEDEPLSPGVVPRSFLEQRCIGEAAVHGAFADIGTAVSLAHLHVALASRLIHYGVAELDAAAIRRGAPRRFNTGHLSLRLRAIQRPWRAQVSWNRVRVAVRGQRSQLGDLRASGRGASSHRFHDNADPP